MLVIAQF